MQRYAIVTNRRGEDSFRKCEVVDGLVVVELEPGETKVCSSTDTEALKLAFKNRNPNHSGELEFPS